MQFQRIAIYLPLLGLIVLIFALYSPQIFAMYIPVLSQLSFMDKITVLLTFALASFAAVEGYSTFMRASMEAKWHKIEDARNELEKAYGPLYIDLIQRRLSGVRIQVVIARAQANHRLN